MQIKTYGNMPYSFESLTFLSSNGYTSTLNNPRQLRPSLHIMVYFVITMTYTFSSGSRLRSIVQRMFGDLNSRPMGP